jgi:hypothetical protein
MGEYNFHMLQPGSSSIFQIDSLYDAFLDVGLHCIFLQNPFIWLILILLCILYITSTSATVQMNHIIVRIHKLKNRNNSIIFQTPGTQNYVFFALSNITPT